MTQREQLYLTAKRYCRAAEDALERNIRPRGFRPLRGFCSSTCCGSTRGASP